MKEHPIVCGCQCWHSWAGWGDIGGKKRVKILSQASLKTEESSNSTASHHWRATEILGPHRILRNLLCSSIHFSNLFFSWHLTLNTKDSTDYWHPVVELVELAAFVQLSSTETRNVNIAVASMTNLNPFLQKKWHRDLWVSLHHILEEANEEVKALMTRRAERNKRLQIKHKFTIKPFCVFSAVTSLQSSLWVEALKPSERVR